MSSSLSSQVSNFRMNFGFSTELGEGAYHDEQICNCGMVYLKNLSTYEVDLPAANLITTGVYHARLLLSGGGQQPLGFLNLDGGDSWGEDDIWAIQIPCGLNVSGGDNFQVNYEGDGYSSLAYFQSNFDRNHLSIRNVNLTVSDDLIMCPGESVELSAQGADSYSWTPSSSLNTSNGSVVIASPEVPTVYTVTGTKSFFCSSCLTTNLVCDAETSVFVDIHDDLEIRLNDIIICESDPWPIIQSPMLPSGATAFWGILLADGSKVLSPFESIIPLQNGPGQYTLNVTTSEGCLFTFSFVFEIISAGFDYTVSEVGNGQIFITVNSSTGLNSDWRLYESNQNGDLLTLVAEVLNETSAQFGPLQSDMYYSICQIVDEPCTISMMRCALIFPGEGIIGDDNNRRRINGKHSLTLESTLGTFVIPIHSELPDNLEGEVAIFNSNGQLIYHDKYNPSDVNMDIGMIKTGIYFVQIQFNDSLISHKIFIY